MTDSKLAIKNIQAKVVAAAESLETAVDEYVASKNVCAIFERIGAKIASGSLSRDTVRGHAVRLALLLTPEHVRQSGGGFIDDSALPGDTRLVAMSLTYVSLAGTKSLGLRLWTEGEGMNPLTRRHIDISGTALIDFLRRSKEADLTNVIHLLTMAKEDVRQDAADLV